MFLSYLAKEQSDIENLECKTRDYNELASFIVPTHKIANIYL